MANSLEKFFLMKVKTMPPVELDLSEMRANHQQQQQQQQTSIAAASSGSAVGGGGNNAAAAPFQPQQSPAVGVVPATAGQQLNPLVNNSSSSQQPHAALQPNPQVRPS